MVSMRGIAATAALAAFAARGEMEKATPESQGVPSAAIAAWIDACEKTFHGGKVGEGEPGRLHGFVIVRRGKTIAEGSWKPFDTLNETHMLYSHSKSFTSSAVGFLADAGKLDLDERVTDIFPESVPAAPSWNLQSLRVRDLLTMNVGAKPDPQRKNPDCDWVKAFLEGDVLRKPGTGFRYDSLATYMLSAIVERRSGMKLMDFLDERMFRKIGIRGAWTTCSPQGIACGGWGMNMTTRDLARFGTLYLQKGRWGGEAVLSPEWVALATARQTWSGWNGKVRCQADARASSSDWVQGYGFQFWRCRHNAYRADGASGQYTIVMPDQEAVVSIHAGLGNMQKEIDLVWDILLPAMKDGTLPGDPAAAALEKRCAELAIPPVPGKASGGAFEGREFRFAKNPRGIASVRFDRADGGWTCALETPAGVQTFPVGCGTWAKGKMRIDTVPYEGLGHVIGEQPVAASGGVDAAGNFAMRAYLTGTTFHVDVNIGADGSCSGLLRGMAGCSFKAE